MEVTDFYKKLKQHCQQQSKGNGENCRQCRFRKFCFTPPINLSDNFVAQTQKSLEELQSEEDKNEPKKMYYKCECGNEYHTDGANYCGKCGRPIKKSAE